MKQTLSFIDSELAQATYFAGSAFTAADIMMTFPFTTMRHFLNYDLAPYAQYSRLPAAHRVAPGLPQGDGARRPEGK